MNETTTRLDVFEGPSGLAAAGRPGFPADRPNTGALFGTGRRPFASQPEASFADTVSETAREAWTWTREETRQFAASAIRRADEFTRRATLWIQANPREALMFGFSAGLLLAQGIISLRSRR